MRAWRVQQRGPVAHSLPARIWHAAHGPMRPAPSSPSAASIPKPRQRSAHPLQTPSRIPAVARGEKEERRRREGEKEERRREEGEKLR